MAALLNAIPPESWKWIWWGLALLVLLVSVLALSRLRFVQTRPLMACTILSLVAHVLLLIAFCLGRWWDLPELPRGAPICFRIVDTCQAEPDEPDSDRESSSSDIPRETRETDAFDIPDRLDVPDRQEAPDASIVSLALQPPTADDLGAPSLISVEESNPSTSSNEVTPTNQHPETTEDDPAPDAFAPTPSRDTHSESFPPLPSSLDLQEPLIASVDTVENRKGENRDGALSPEPAEEGWHPVPDSVNPTDVKPEGTAATSARSNLPHFSHRSVQQRAALLGAYGGDDRTEAAVRRALIWLQSAQAADGRWSAQTHGAGLGGFIEGQVRTGIGIRADTGITGLALLAFLGAGYLPEDPEFGPCVRRGIEYLLHSQAPQGSLAGDADPFARTYCHGIATLALGEYLCMTGDPRCREPVQRAVQATLRAQHRITGGWRYQPGEEGDTSQLGWQVMALSSGSRAGVDLPVTALSRARSFLQSVSGGAHGGLAAYRRGELQSPAMTAEALVCRLLLNDAHPRQVDEAVNYLLLHPPGHGPMNCYYNYYGSLALHLAGANWDSWNKAMQHEWLTRQVSSGPQAGSWDTNTVWGRCGGRVYTTAIGALCLEVYYRYLPLMQRATIANRSGS